MWLAVWGTLFVIMHIPVEGSVPVPKGGDKVIHLIAYFVLALAGGRSAMSRGIALTSRWLVTWLIVYAVYGAADELLQGLVNRSPSVADWVADVCGASAALGIMYVNRKRPEDIDES